MPVIPFEKVQAEFERIATGMDLRPPQRHSLEVLKDILISLPRPVKDLSAQEIATRIRTQNPTWTFPEGFPSLTFALAR